MSAMLEHDARASMLDAVSIDAQAHATHGRTDARTHAEHSSSDDNSRIATRAGGLKDSPIPLIETDERGALFVLPEAPVRVTVHHQPRGNAMSETIKASRFTVENEDQMDDAMIRLCEHAFDLTVIRGGDGSNYIAWETEYGDTYAIRPCTEDEYDRERGGHQSVTVHLEDVPLPWTVLTTAPANPSRLSPSSDLSGGV
jgi:dipeptidyl aminopeptidase/acylaminoacyl peptidase